MAKKKAAPVPKKVERVKVKCIECQFGGEEVVNHLIMCSNEIRNPQGFKMGTWAHYCDYYKKRELLNGKKANS